MWHTSCFAVLRRTYPKHAAIEKMTYSVGVTGWSPLRGGVLRNFLVMLAWISKRIKSWIQKLTGTIYWAL